MYDAEMINICGMRGSGKSTKVKELVKGPKRLIVFDPMGEYVEAGCRAVAWADIKKEISKKACKISYKPPEKKRAYTLSALADVIRQVQTIHHKFPITLVVEEMSLSYPVNILPDDCQGFTFLCEQGRHLNIEVIGTQQRPATVSKKFIGNCSQHYIFGLDWAIDVDGVCQLMGREYKDDVRGLQTHEYLHYSRGVVTPGQNKLKKR